MAMFGWRGTAFLLVAALTGGSADAAPDRVVIEQSGPVGLFGGHNYFWAIGRMEGTVSRHDGTVGTYRVPITLSYPAGSGNGFGFVDVVNNADFYNFEDDRAILGRATVNYTGNLIFSDFLRMEGFTYMSVQWSRMTTEVLGLQYGLIQHGEDGYEIIKDAARWLRGEGTFEGLDMVRPELPQHVVGHGFSHTTSVLTGFLWRGDNREADNALVYDGFFLGSLEPFTCRLLNNDATIQELPGRPLVPLFTGGAEQCSPLPDDGKVIHLRTQSDVERRGNEAYEAPNYRLYDLAGAAHVPEFLETLKLIGAERQNPVNWQPVARALLAHLVEWVLSGREPPPPLHIEGHFEAEGQFRLATDQDGNAAGGIRLPHVATLLPSGEWAGAPLGVYGGIDADLSASAGFGYAGFGGTFRPFPPDEIARRYPTQDAYVDLVSRAAAALLQSGYILPEGYDFYVRAARLQDLMLAPPLPDTAAPR